MALRHGAWDGDDTVRARTVHALFPTSALVNSPYGAEPCARRGEPDRGTSGARGAGAALRRGGTLARMRTFVYGALAALALTLTACNSKANHQELQPLPGVTT